MHHGIVNIVGSGEWWSREGCCWAETVQSSADIGQCIGEMVDDVIYHILIFVACDEIGFSACHFLFRFLLGSRRGSKYALDSSAALLWM
mmetsp:Transcript_27837/g.59436  ORF Transcript_27837/g.59436 Transcript_27837/m.59436 type:complete len:89 (+) Transcript_27837:646-912(+)